MNQPSKSKLLDIILTGENQFQEFKTSFSKEAIETITAFANSTGGIVYIGIDDSGRIKGIDVGKETIQIWQNQVKLKTQPSLFPDIDVMDIDGKKIVCLTIQEHPIKPVSCKGKCYQAFSH